MGGKVYTVIFGCVGIVVTGFILGVFTSAIDALLESLHYRVAKRSYHSRRHTIRFKAMATALILVFYLGVAAAVAAAREEMAYGDALYMIFITISTGAHLTPSHAFSRLRTPSHAFARLLTRST